MSKLKYTLKIIATNWVHLVGFYLTTYLSLILFKLLGLEEFADEGWNEILLFSIISIPLLFFTYGLMIIGGFFGAIALLDIIAFNLKRDKVKLVLILEWIIIIPSFIYWAFEYDYWLWVTLSVSFLVTQLIRKTEIEKIVMN